MYVCMYVCMYVYVRVAGRNRTLAHIRRFEKMADEVGATENRLLVCLRAITHPFGRKTLEYSLLVPLLPKRTNWNALSYQFKQILSCASLWLGCLRQNRLFTAPPSQWTSQSASPHLWPILVRPLAAAGRASGASAWSGVPLTIWWARQECPSSHALWRNLSAL